MSEPALEKYTASFVVRIKEDGSIETTPVQAGEYMSRTATTFDIYQCCKELVHNIDTQLLADRIVEALMVQNDPNAEKRSRINSALNERGISPQQ